MTEAETEQSRRMWEIPASPLPPIALVREHLDGELASVLKDTIPFEAARCARITDAVMERLRSADGSKAGLRE